MPDKRTAAVPSAQCWLDAGLDKSLTNGQQWHGLMNAYNHTENALFAERRISESYEADRLEQKAEIEQLRWKVVGLQSDLLKTLDSASPIRTDEAKK